MPSSDPQVISPQFALEMQRRMRELGLNSMELARQIGKAYDHVRKVYNGNVFPGPTLLKPVCERLDLDYGAMERLVLADKGVHKGYASAMTGRDPWINQIEHYVPFLTQQDRLEVLALVKLKASFQMAERKIAEGA